MYKSAFDKWITHILQAVNCEIWHKMYFINLNVICENFRCNQWEFRLFLRCYIPLHVFFTQCMKENGKSSQRNGDRNLADSANLTRIFSSPRGCKEHIQLNLHASAKRYFVLISHLKALSVEKMCQPDFPFWSRGIRGDIFCRADKKGVDSLPR